MLSEWIRKASAGQSLGRKEVLGCVDALLSPDASPDEASAWLVALRLKGETPVEIAAVAEALRLRANPIDIADSDAVDTCGTGGDGAHTFNISTAAAFVAAGAGVTVAKHGNRAVSSQCGSADVLEALGVDLTAPMERVRASIDKQRIGFLFAQHYHPALSRAAPVRRKLGLRTIFNLAGPLANPAGVHRQLVGVPSAELVEVVARSLVLLGVHRAWVVFGTDGLDELSLAGETLVAEVRKDGSVRRFIVTPEQAGFSRAMTVTLRGGNAATNAAILRKILAGHMGPERDAVLLNAAAALVVGNRAADLRDGAVLAANAVDSGAAMDRLQCLLAATGKREPCPAI